MLFLQYLCPGFVELVVSVVIVVVNNNIDEELLFLPGEKLGSVDGKALCWS